MTGITTNAFVQIGTKTFQFFDVPARETRGNKAIPHSVVQSLRVRAAIHALEIEDDNAGAAIAFARGLLRMTGRELAAELRVTPETLSRWENGQRRPSPTAVKLLVAMLHFKDAGEPGTVPSLASARDEVDEGTWRCTYEKEVA